MTPSYEQVIETIQHLQISEQKKVLDWLEQRKPELDKKMTEEELERQFIQRLLDKGLISKIPPSWDDDEEFEPIEFEGESLSEMIIRERR